MPRRHGVTFQDPGCSSIGVVRYEALVTSGARQKEGDSDTGLSYDY